MVMTDEQVNRIKTIAIVIEKDIDYYVKVRDFLDLYHQDFFDGSFLLRSIIENQVIEHHNYIVFSDYNTWAGASINSVDFHGKIKYNINTDIRVLHDLFNNILGMNIQPVIDNTLTLNEIKELKKTIWVKLNSEQEIKKAYDLLVKYNQLMYKDKNGIPLLIGSDHMSEGYLGMNMKTNPEFSIWSNNSHNTSHTEEIIVRHCFIIDNLELLEHLFKEEAKILNTQF